MLSINVRQQTTASVTRRIFVPMKSLLLLVASFAGSTIAFAAEPSAPASKLTYHEFLEKFALPETLTDCIAKMDRLIDAGEATAAAAQPGTGWVNTATQTGLQLQFRIRDREEAIIYYLVISRGGDELKYSDATKMAALFADR